MPGKTGMRRYCPAASAETVPPDGGTGLAIDVVQRTSIVQVWPATVAPLGTGFAPE